MPNSLYPSGSLDQLPHFASPMKESAVISSVMVVLYPFLLHTVNPLDDPPGTSAPSLPRFRFR